MLRTRTKTRTQGDSRSTVDNRKKSSVCRSGYLSVAYQTIDSLDPSPNVTCQN